MPNLAYLRIVPTINPHVANLEASFGECKRTVGVIRLRHDLSLHMGKSSITLILYRTWINDLNMDSTSIQVAANECCVGKFTWMVSGGDTVDKCTITFAPNVKHICSSIMKQIIAELHIQEIYFYDCDDYCYCMSDVFADFKSWILASMIKTNMDDFNEKSYDDIVIANIERFEPEVVDSTTSENVLKFGASKASSFECGYLYAGKDDYRLSEDEMEELPERYAQGNAVAVDVKLRTAKTGSAEVVVMVIDMHHVSKGTDPIKTTRIIIDSKMALREQACQAFTKMLMNACYGYGADEALRVYFPSIRISDTIGTEFWRWLKEYSPVSPMVKMIHVMQYSHYGLTMDQHESD